MSGNSAPSRDNRNNYNRNKKKKINWADKTMDKLAKMDMKVTFDEFNKCHLDEDVLTAGISIPANIYNDDGSVYLHDMTAPHKGKQFLKLFGEIDIGKQILPNLCKVEYNSITDTVNFLFEPLEDTYYPNFKLLFGAIKTITTTCRPGTRYMEHIENVFSKNFRITIASRDKWACKLLLRNVYMVQKLQRGFNNIDPTITDIGDKFYDVFKLKCQNDIKLTRWNFKDKWSNTALAEINTFHTPTEAINLIKSCNANIAHDIAPFKMKLFTNKREEYFNKKMVLKIKHYERIKRLKAEERIKQEQLRKQKKKKEEEELKAQREEKLDTNVDTPPSQEDNDVEIENNNNNNNNNSSELNNRNENSTATDINMNNTEEEDDEDEDEDDEDDDDDDEHEDDDDEQTTQTTNETNTNNTGIYGVISSAITNLYTPSKQKQPPQRKSNRLNGLDVDGFPHSADL